MKRPRESKKLDLLKHYERQEAHAFWQLEAFINVPPGDPLVIPDGDGDSLCSGITYELMSGGPAVRILVAPQVRVVDVRRILRKVQDGLNRDGFTEDADLAEKALDVPVCPHCGNNPEEEPLEEPFPF